MQVSVAVDRAELPVESDRDAGLSEYDERGECQGVVGQGTADMSCGLSEDFGRVAGGGGVLLLGEVVVGVCGESDGEVAEEVDVAQGGEEATGSAGDAMFADVGDDRVERIVGSQIVEIAGFVRGDEPFPDGS
ncbi:hypothetical protein [Streptomyces sp. T028]|uniref:hypothetical protein n=1 Tax=Streptomyces sp. T028 TaxID=3394379 RepID=UPI003A87EBEF